MIASLNTRLASYLTPHQATVLRYDGTLPQATLDSLCDTLRHELSGMQSLVPHALLHEPARFETGDGTSWDGTVLCADLSGFTTLTSQLAAAGRQGVEELSSLINQVFAALLDEIDTYGGSVLKFGGDALTAFFDAEHLGQNHALAGCTAALALQESMRAFETITTSCGEWSLRLRIAVHSGRIFVASIGDESRRELLTTGRAINQVALVQERAVPGEVLVSGATLALVGAATTEPRAGGLLALRSLAVRAESAPLPSPSPLPLTNDLLAFEQLVTRIDLLRPYVPSSLPQRFLVGGTNADNGEFRPVTELFVNFFSFSGLLSLLEGEERSALQGLDAYFQGVHRVVQNYGGSINKLDISGFGDKLLLLFGAPHAHEDDPQRAVQTALELRDVLAQANTILREALDRSAEGRQLQDMNRPVLPPWRAINPAFRQRIGVSTGMAFAGMVGTARRREYTVIGHTVNMAARLMGAAEPEKVLLDPATTRMVARKVALRPLPPLQLKGFARPVGASQALHATPPALPASPGLPSAPLVGRNAELELLRMFAHETLAGTGRIVALSGEAGIGKSRLANELLKELLGSEMGSIALSCRAAAQASPLGLVRELVCKILNMPPGIDPIVLRAPLAQLVVDYAPAYIKALPLLDELANETGESSLDTTGYGDDPFLDVPQTERRRRLLDLVVAVLSGLIGQQPLALFIDDLHDADETSLALVNRLADVAHTRPLLLLLAYRPDEQVYPWLAHPHATRLDIQKLDRASSAAQLAQLLGGEVPEALEPLLDRVQGSPFFLEAFVRHLIDNGALVQQSWGTWELTRPLSEVQIPISIERVMAARLDRLDEATHEVLQAAAVIGNCVPYAVLAGVYSQARRLAHRVTYLVHIGLFDIDENDAQAPFCFRQTLLRDVVYNRILYAQRRELHRRVAERIAQVYEQSLDDHLLELAYHHQMAEDWPEAFGYAMRAAHLAVSSGAYSVARLAATRAAAIAAATDTLTAADGRALQRLQRLLKHMGET